MVIEKHNILTCHNKKKVRESVGLIGLPLVYILQENPWGIFQNFWGNYRKLLLDLRTIYIKPSSLPFQERKEYPETTYFLDDFPLKRYNLPTLGR